MVNIELIIQQINSKIDETEFVFTNPSLSEGPLSFSLYYYYRYLYSKDENFLINITEYIVCSFSKINSGFNVSVFDLIEMGRYLCFLVLEELLDINQLSKYNIDTKDVINKYLEDMILNKNLDGTVGIVAIGHYFLDLYSSGILDKDYLKYKIDYIITNINSLAKEVDDFMSWEFVLRNSLNPIEELNLFHGTAGVLHFFSRCKHLKFLSDDKFIIKPYNFLMSLCDFSSNICFPFDADNKYSKPKFLNLAYGDLGIGHAILMAGRVLHDKKIENNGLLILQNASKLRDDGSEYIVDAELTYGSSGLMSYFDLLNRLYPCEAFESSSSYWLNRTQTFHNIENRWAGFETYMNGFRDDIQLSFFHGIAGISMSLMSKNKNLEYKFLTFLNYHFF